MDASYIILAIKVLITFFFITTDVHVVVTVLVATIAFDLIRLYVFVLKSAWFTAATWLPKLCEITIAICKLVLEYTTWLIVEVIDWITDFRESYKIVFLVPTAWNLVVHSLLVESFVDYRTSLAHATSALNNRLINITGYVICMPGDIIEHLKESIILCSRKIFRRFSQRQDHAGFEELTSRSGSTTELPQSVSDMNVTNINNTSEDVIQQVPDNRVDKVVGKISNNQSGDNEQLILGTVDSLAYPTLARAYNTNLRDIMLEKESNLVEKEISSSERNHTLTDIIRNNTVFLKRKKFWIPILASIGCIYLYKKYVK